MTQHPLFMIAVYCMSSYKSSNGGGGAASRSRWWRRPGDVGNPCISAPHWAAPSRSVCSRSASGSFVTHFVPSDSSSSSVDWSDYLPPITLGGGLAFQFRRPAAAILLPPPTVPTLQRRRRCTDSRLLRTTLTRVKFLSMIHGEKCWKCIDTAAVRASKQTLHYSKMGNP